MSVLVSIIAIFFYSGIGAAIAVWFFFLLWKKYMVYMGNHQERVFRNSLGLILSLIICISCSVQSISIALFIVGLIDSHIPFLFSAVIVPIFSLLWMFYNIIVLKKKKGATYLFSGSLVYFLMIAIAAPGFVKWDSYESGGFCAGFRSTYIGERVNEYTTKHNLSHNKEIAISWDDLEEILTIYYYTNGNPADYQYDLKSVKKSIIRDHKSADCPYYLLDGKLYCKIHDKPLEDKLPKEGNPK